MTEIPCNECNGLSCVIKDGKRMTSVKFCTELQECSREIDWEEVLGSE